MLFCWIAVIVINGICLLVPRRLTWIEILAVTWFGLYFECLTNVILDLKYDLYGYFGPGPDLKALIPIIGLYPALNYLLLNFFPFKKGLLRIAVYVAGWGLFAILFELSSIYFHIFYYNTWKWWYSAMSYPPIFITLALHLRLIRFAVSQSIAKKHPSS